MRGRASRVRARSWVRPPFIAVGVGCLCTRLLFALPLPDSPLGCTACVCTGSAISSQGGGLLGGLQALLLLVLFAFSAAPGGVSTLQTGCVFSLLACDSMQAMFCLCFPSPMQACSECLWLRSATCFLPPAGQLVWRRHGPPDTPSHRALRATCVQLLPLVEMYCRWELQEDCGDLNALMHRFDSESVLETHALGRSLLLMLRDEDMGLQVHPPPMNFLPAVNPFDAIRSRLRAVDNAFHAMRPQVCPVVFCLGLFFFVWGEVLALCCALIAEHCVHVQDKFNGNFYIAVFSPMCMGLGVLEHLHCNVCGMGLPIFLQAMQIPIFSLLDTDLVGFPEAFMSIQAPNLSPFFILFCICLSFCGATLCPHITRFVAAVQG